MNANLMTTREKLERAVAALKAIANSHKWCGGPYKGEERSVARLALRELGEDLKDW
jgi:hypothetical protein